jgi:hypothetical protein
VLARAASAAVPAADVGVAGGNRLICPDFDVTVTETTSAWRDAIPRALEHLE